MPNKPLLRKIYGRRAVLEALRSLEVRVEKIIVAKGTHGTVMEELQELARAKEVPVETRDRHRLDKLAGPVANQGVLAVLKSGRHTDVTGIIEKAQAQRASGLLVVSDEIEDPRNLGAIARCAEGAGAQGMLITMRRSADVTAASEKASGGALTHLPVARVVNLVDAMHRLQDAGLWTVGLDAAQGRTLWEADLRRPLALVVGNEGKGLRRLTKESCDMLVRIPMLGKVDSLNAAVAAGIALFEVIRQRTLHR
ncbi:23S rRNA (guanosine(2251)-2'-O)-methyltransferase RlmB [candidate division FCPU426 bacterium]|nr:23S rRNA (guanosine(2251)-2'-O)-methyltransferase RlmB [candidate division FCPU426 bacterium]